MLETSQDLRQVSQPQDLPETETNIILLPHDLDELDALMIDLAKATADNNVAISYTSTGTFRNHSTANRALRPNHSQ
jgi:hypothetical protein